MELKHCYKCGADKPHSEYHKNKSRYDGLTSECKKCHYVKGLVHRMRTRYGITISERKAMELRQRTQCAICGTQSSRSLAVDHCHTTLRIRGLLCTQCNRGIGIFKDDPSRLRAAAAYLERKAA